MNYSVENAFQIFALKDSYHYCEEEALCLRKRALIYFRKIFLADGDNLATAIDYEVAGTI